MPPCPPSSLLLVLLGSFPPDSVAETSPLAPSPSSASPSSSDVLPSPPSSSLRICRAPPPSKRSPPPPKLRIVAAPPFASTPLTIIRAPPLPKSAARPLLSPPVSRTREPSGAVVNRSEKGALAPPPSPPAAPLPPAAAAIKDCNRSAAASFCAASCDAISSAVHTSVPSTEGRPLFGVSSPPLLCGAASVLAINSPLSSAAGSSTRLARSSAAVCWC